MPLACGIVLLAAAPAARRSAAGLERDVLDLALVLALGAIALQLVPLPAGLRGRLAPAAVAYDRAMRFGRRRCCGERPLSIDPAATLLALVGRRGHRAAVLVRPGRCFGAAASAPRSAAVAWIGLFVSPLAIVQHLMPLPIVDAMWGVTSRGLRPYGPFVNRNDFAGWLIMAIPLTLGYAVARMQSRHRAGETLRSGDCAVDTKSIWLGMAVCLMLAGLLFSLSRSGLLGACAGLVCFAWLVRAGA